jgi:hypothetical protein
LLTLKPEACNASREGWSQCQWTMESRRKENTLQRFEIAGLAEGKGSRTTSISAFVPLDLQR